MIKKDAYYFPHYINARNDRKLRKARLQMGIEAYAIYFMTLEVLREQKDFKYPFEDLDVLAADIDTTLQKLEVIVMNYGLFELDFDKNFFSPAQILALEPWIRTRELNSLKGKKSGEARRKKIEKQLKDLKNIESLSHQDSTEPQLNHSLTPVEQIINEVNNKEKNKIKISLSNNEEDFLDNFDSFVSYMRANFINREIIETNDRYTGEIMNVYIDPDGYLYDLNNCSENFKGSRAKEIWKSLYDLALKNELPCIIS